MAQITVLAVDAPVHVHGLVVIHQGPDVLARAEHQHPVALQREVEQAEHLLLGVGLQIDQQVPARHQIDARERSVLDHVVRREHHALSQLGRHLVARPALVEVALEQVGPDPVDAILGVQTAAREIERPAVQSVARIFSRRASPRLRSSS